MKFKFCGDLDAPDFLLKEIDTVSKISVVRLKLILAQIVKGLLGDSIDFKKVDDLVSKSNLTSGDVKGAIAGIDFIIKSGCKYNVDEETLAMELQQLGLPTEHCEAFGKVYSAAKENLQAKLKSETLKFTRLGDDRPIEWRVDYVMASSANKEICAPVAQLKFNLLSPDGGQNRVAVEVDQEQFRVLLAELREAKAIVDSLG